MGLVKPSFVLGILTGYGVDWFAGAMRITGGVLPNIDVTIASQTSPDRATALMQGRVDVACMRREMDTPDLAFARGACFPRYANTAFIKAPNKSEVRSVRSSSTGSSKRDKLKWIALTVSFDTG